jgi:hypothetical protein
MVALELGASASYGSARLDQRPNGQCGGGVVW